MLNTITNTLSYWAIRTLGYPLSFCSYRTISRLGRYLGSIAYYCSRKHRKRCMTNLSIAHDLDLNEQEMKLIAKQSFQNLITTTMEFFRLPRSKKDNFRDFLVAENSEVIEKLHDSHQGIVFFSGHQANWEAPLFDVSCRKMKGIAIGRPIKNDKLYQWILSIRQMAGGEIIEPRSALSRGLKELKRGNYVGIVGDQGFPASSYSKTFLGTRAWTTSAPALLAYRTNSPIVVGTSYRQEHKLHIHYHPPIYPNLKNSLKTEVPRLMDQTLQILEDSIKKHPAQWLWQHQRWKQHAKGLVHKKYRYDFILVILPDDKTNLEKVIPQLPALEALYPRGFITYMITANYSELLNNCYGEVIPFIHPREKCLQSWKYQMILDFSGSSAVRKHFLKLGAFVYYNLSHPETINNFTGYLNDNFRR
ncbi:MAG: lysophospholipid acyltransferase family protein [Chlamydiota bacterium]